MPGSRWIREVLLGLSNRCFEGLEWEIEILVVVWELERIDL